jgi:uncharacterized LabA/DUF88 family protein
MKKANNSNYAFIDSTNLHKGVTDTLGWKLDYKKFRTLLKDKYNVDKAYMFMGFIPTNTGLYTDIQNFGYEIIFKPTIPKEKETKGNCDAELVLQAMIDYEKYNKAIIVSGDGDFYCLIDYLQKHDKLEVVISPNIKWCSSLIKRLGHKIKLVFIEQLRAKLEYLPNTSKGPKNEKVPK